MNFKKINWVAFRKYTSPQAMKDFDSFLDALPLNVGYNGLIAAGMAWLLAGSALFFTSAEMSKISKMHTDLFQVQALQPPIPVLLHVAVGQETLKPLADKLLGTYKGISIVTGEGKAVVTAQDTDFFPQFLAAISYLQRGGKNWRVGMDTFCVGSACAGSKLSATLKIESLRLGEPEVKKEGDDVNK